MKISYEEIYENYYLNKLSIYNTPYLKHIKKDTKNIIINWKGNKQNIAESFTRGLKLHLLEPLFSIPNINWISIQKDLLPEEKILLDKYNITNLQNIDSNGDSFKESISLFRNIDLLISTDTSMIHVAGSIGIHCCILLPLGRDWRWRDNRSNWYKKVKQYIQPKPTDWTSAIKELKTDIENNTYL
jgi:hypothetical protein